jgi:hypothetical protein
MSTREQCAQLLASVPEYKLGYVVAYLQGLLADEADCDNPPFNAETRQAIEDARNGIGLSPAFKSVAEMMDYLDKDD